MAHARVLWRRRAAVLPGGVSSGEGAWRAGSRWGGCHGGCLPLPRGQLAPRCAPMLLSAKDVFSDPNLCARWVSITDVAR